MITPERYEKLRAIFIEVCDLGPERRGEVLDEPCTGDPQRLDHAKALLVGEVSEYLAATGTRDPPFQDIVETLVRVCEARGDNEEAEKYRLLLETMTAGDAADE